MQSHSEAIEQRSSDAQPYNIEAEQLLLGALLTDNAVFERITHTVGSEHFYDPVHARIFSAVVSLISKNTTANPVTLGKLLEGDTSFKELGGEVYLSGLITSSNSVLSALEDAQIIYDLAVRRELTRISKDIAHIASKSDSQIETNELVAEAERALFSVSKPKSDQGLQPVLHAITAAITKTNESLQKEGGLAGLPTGFFDLDKKLGGLHKSDLLILAGRPSMGKTSLATNIAFNIARASGKKEPTQHSQDISPCGVVGFFSLEMSSEQLAARILSDAAEVSSENIRRGNLTELEFRRFVDAAKALESCPLFIDDTPALSIRQLMARARRLKHTHGLDVVIVDYLQLLRGSERSDGRAGEVSEITMGLKAIAKELRVPVLALSQLSRQVESRDDKRPILSDLRESGSIEQDADVVMFIFREEYYKEREKPGDHQLEEMVEWQEEMQRLHGKAEVIISKQRHGPIGTVELSFEGKFTRFGNLAKLKPKK